jgi:hypothetical protein
MKLTVKQEQILRAMSTVEYETPTTIGKRCGKEYYTASSWVCNSMKSLIDKGLVEKKGRKYRATTTLKMKKNAGFYNKRMGQFTEGPETKSPLPEPLYSCVICYEEYSWPAENLFWNNKKNGWMCENCFSCVDETKGICLKDEINNRESRCAYANGKLSEALQKLGELREILIGQTEKEE